jgi:cytochrome c oxidase subunit 2
MVALRGMQIGIPSPFLPSGQTAMREASLGWWLIAIGVAVVVVVSGLVLVGAMRRRQESAEHMRAAGGGVRWIVVGGIILPTIILLVAFGMTLKALQPAARAAAPPISIEITGHRWWWEIRYQGKDAHAVVLTANEIHIPIGQEIPLTLKSGDVIHSFWVPQLGGKIDLIPGQPNTMWLEADRPGLYRGQCAEFCGMEHARMALLVVAETPGDFATWFAHQQEAATVPDEVAVRGHDLVVGGPCALCHLIRGTSAGGRQGPDLTHLAGRRTLAAGMVPNDRAWLTAWIADPQAIKPGALMPALGLKSQDLVAVVQYLQSLK